MRESRVYLYIEDLKRHDSMPEDSILSRTLHSDDRLKIIWFCFAPGQELSAHTAPFPATLYFAQGEARLKLGDDEREAREGAFVYMPAKLEHAIKAKSEVVMVLTMVKSRGEEPRLTAARRL